MYGTANIVFVVFAGLAALLVAIPLPKALTSGNVGTSMVVLWTWLACLVQLINAVLWHGNVENWSPAWCDFCGYFLITTDLALTGCGLSIARRLYTIVTLGPRRHEKVYNMAVDFILCLVIPLALSPLKNIVQQYRFYIFEDIGCLPGVANVNLAYPLVWMLPLLMGTVSAGYACLTFRENLRRNHKQTGDLGTNAAWSRRMLALGAVCTLYGLVPTTTSIVLLATTYPVTPWPGWGALHSTIDDVIYVTAQEWQSHSITAANTELRRWTIVSLAFVIFLFLGLTEDVKRMYCAPFRSIIGKTFSSDQPTWTTMIEQNADRDLKDLNDPRSSRYHRSGGFISLEKIHEEMRQESHSSTDKPWLDLGGQGFELVYPVAPPPAATRTTYPRRIPHYERGSGTVYV